MALQDAIERIQDLALGLSGVRAAPDDPANKIAYGPMVITYARNGTFEGNSENWTTGRHVIYSEFHLPYQGDLARGVAKMRGYIESFADAILGDVTLNDTVQAVTSFDYDFMVWTWPTTPQTQTLGYQFMIGVKLHRDLS